MTEVTVRVGCMNNSQEFLCFSFSRKDFETMLFGYNAVYFLSYYFVANDFKLSFLMAYLFSLITMFVFLFVDIFEKIENDEQKHQEEAKIERMKLRNEYQKAHNVNRKIELLHKAGCLEENENISAIDEPSIDLPNHNNVARAVHINYLKRFGPARLPKNKAQE